MWEKYCINIFIKSIDCGAISFMTRCNNLPETPQRSPVTSKLKVLKVLMISSVNILKVGLLASSSQVVGSIFIRGKCLYELQKIVPDLAVDLNQSVVGDFRLL